MEKIMMKVFLVFSLVISVSFALEGAHYVSFDDKEEYISDLTSQIIKKQKDFCPFGVPQTEAARNSLNKQEEVKEQKKTEFPLSKILADLSVQFVNPSKGYFLTKGRKVKKGQEVSIVFKGEQQKLKVIGVTSSAIEFLHLNTEEKAKLKVGVSSGVFGKRKIPTIKKRTSNQPLILGN